MRLSEQGQPAYQAIPELIRDDVRSGRLVAGDRLPSLRELAAELALDYTTVARAYAEARRRGLVDSAPGRGTTVRAATPKRSARPVSPLEMTMNMPPEPRDPALLQRMQAGIECIARLGDPHALLRYQEFGGNPEDCEAAAHWLQPVLPAVHARQVLVTPGIQTTLAGLFALLASSGEVILAEPLTYPGVKAIAAQFGLRVVAIPADAAGVLPAGFEHACKELKPRLLYLNPCLNNPTTRSMPLARREAIADLALRYAVPIIEDDAYGMLPEAPVTSFAALAPEITWYLTGLSKCLGAGLRVAWLVPPDASRRRLAVSTLRSASIMASPLTTALASHWIRDGTANLVLEAVRRESRARQALLGKELQGVDGLRVHADGDAFHAWLELPATVNRLTLSAQLRSEGVLAVASDTFTMEGTPPNAMRLCLGGMSALGDCHQALARLRDLLRQAASVNIPLEQDVLLRS